jgi:hypothetical protein
MAVERDLAALPREVMSQVGKLSRRRECTSAAVYSCNRARPYGQWLADRIQRVGVRFSVRMTNRLSMFGSTR